MRILLDTCAISELRHPHGNVSVKEAIGEIASENIFLSVISIGEILKGITLLDEGQRKRDLSSWVNMLECNYNKRLLPVDTTIARLWGEITATAQKSGKILSASDGLIAATAIRHGLYVMTRNVQDFIPTGVLLVNPWDNKPCKTS